MRSNVFLATLLLPFVAAAATPFKSFDVNGAATTCGLAISGRGLVLGLAQGGSLASAKYFLYHSDTAKFSFPAPNVPAGIVFLDGLERNGTILGSDFNLENQTETGFLYHDHTATPLTGLANSAAGINDRGILFGQQGVFPGGFLGFVLRPSGAVTTLNDGSNYVQPSAIDITGNRVVGQALGGAFFYKNGKFSYLHAPGATVGTYPRGVDSQDRISGSYDTGTQTQPVSNGFLLRDGIYATWNVAGATATEIDGANEAGQITGCYTDTTGTHGFIATP